MPQQSWNHYADEHLQNSIGLDINNAQLFSALLWVAHPQLVAMCYQKVFWMQMSKGASFVA